MFVRSNERFRFTRRHGSWAVRLKAALQRRTSKQKKSGGRIQTAALKLSILPEQEFYEDLYLTEQPYGLVSGVLTDLPASD